MPRMGNLNHTNQQLSQVNFDEQDELKFVAIGDWGSGCRRQKKMAKAIGQWCEQNGCDFILSTGDNFYPYGVKSPKDKQFDEKWRNIYNHPSIKEVPW